MAKHTIGKRKSVADIREVWAKETEFSDWLAQDDGMELIAEDLGLQIENAKREAKSANFQCDIVGNRVGEEHHIVVIENQYGRTDHDHLGKLLTYAATHKAMSGIWIAERVTDDHRQVIDWLNAVTPDTVSLFAVELKAYTIGNSAAAPQLDVVCRPNAAQKMVNSSKSDADEARYTWRKAFWTDIHDAIRLASPALKLQSPSTDHWSSISIGRSGFHVAMLLVPRIHSIGLELYVDPSGWSKAAFDLLLAESSTIEKSLGETLEWNRLDDRRACRIVLMAKLDPSVESNRDAVVKWFADRTAKFCKVFRAHVIGLKVPEPMPSI